MKKFLFLGAMAAMLLGTASCSNDMEPAIGDGTVQFKVELPGGFDSRAIADGTTATKLEVACYDANGNKLAVEPTVKSDFVNREATVTYKLVKGQKYNFAFFAHADGAPYTFSAGTKLDECEFDVNYNGACNAENRDAFYAVLEDYVVSATTTDVTLHRPFAQLNFGADDLEAAAAAGIVPSQSKVKVSKAATTFNLKSGESTGEAAVEYTLADLPNELLKVEGNTYSWMEMCYFLVPDNEANVDVEMTVKTNGQDVVVPVTSVPVKKNHRTNIVGSLFTQEANFHIIIDQNFDNYDYDIVNGELMLKSGMTTDEINGLIAMGFGAYALAEDLDITKPIVVPAGVTATLNLNGHNIINTQDIWDDVNLPKKWSLISVQGGNLTINGNGQVAGKAGDCYAIDVRDDGNITINGGDYNGNISAVYVIEGHATINGGSFNIQQLPSEGDYRFLLNLYDASRRNGTASIEVNGGKYYQFDPENNLAEGPNTNFLAPGYESVQDGDWYKVQPITPVEVSTDKQLSDALKATGKKNIAVKLMNDLSLDFGARVKYGDENTKNVIIDGNGHTLNLGGTDSDWSSCGAAGNSNFIVKNATINFTRINGGNNAWNNHAWNIINGGTGKIYLQNLKINNSVSIANDAEIEGVDFYDAGHFYGLIIKANVANTTINNCTFIANVKESSGDGGRGIKVNDQYIDAADRVQCNINISNCSFETIKKGAILVTNTAGAKITASNLDISKVAADPENAVWNDSNRKDAWDLVVVSGCTKKQE